VARAAVGSASDRARSSRNIIGHVNSLSPHRIPFSLERLLPGYSDRLAYGLGLIDTQLPMDRARARFKVNERALEYAESPDFSIRIREVEQD
jgi:hypothetical protein